MRRVGGLQDEIAAPETDGVELPPAFDPSPRLFAPSIAMDIVRTTPGPPIHNHHRRITTALRSPMAQHVLSSPLPPCLPSLCRAARPVADASLACVRQAYPILFLASDESAAMTGIDVPVDGGFSIKGIAALAEGSNPALSATMTE